MNSTLNGTLYAAYGVGTSLVLAFSVVLNGSAIFVFVREKKTFLISYGYLLLSLFMNCLLFPVLYIPFTIAASIRHGWFSTRAGCDANGFGAVCGGINAVFHMTAMSYLRYRAIRNPFAAESLITPKRLTLICVSLWTFSALLSAVPILGWSSYRLEGLMIDCSLLWVSSNPSDIAYISILFIVSYFIPIIVSVMSYYKFFRAVNLIKRRAQVTQGTASDMARESTRTERTIAISIVLMLFTYLLTWTPYAILSLKTVSSMNPERNLQAHTAVTLFAKCFSIWPSMIVFFTHSQFRKSFARTFGCQRLTQLQATVTSVITEQPQIMM